MEFERNQTVVQLAPSATEEACEAQSLNRATLLDFRELRYFVAIAEDLHFRKAAERLHIAQPALSHALQRLERKLNLELIQRTTRTVSLTEAGGVLLREAQQLLRQADRFVERAVALSEGEIGTLSLGYTALAATAVARTIRSFSDAHPGIQTPHRQQYSRMLETGVEEAVLDCAFVVSHELVPTLSAERAFELPLVAVVGPHHALATNRWISVQKIEGCPIAMIDDPSGNIWRDLIGTILERYGVRPRFVPISDPVGRFPTEVIAESDELVFISTDDWAHPSLPQIRIDPVITVTVDLIWRTDNVKPSIDALRRHIASLR